MITRRHSSVIFFQRFSKTQKYAKQRERFTRRVFSKLWDFFAASRAGENNVLLKVAVTHSSYETVYVPKICYTPRK